MVPGTGTVFLRAGIFALDTTVAPDGTVLESAFFLVAGVRGSDLCSVFA